MEKWKPINEVPKYSVSNLGKIKNNKTNLLLKLHTDKDGYKDICLSKTGRNDRIYRRIHRLVATAFIPNPNNYPMVNHKNGIKDDNNVHNLEWCDNSYNVLYSYKIGTNKNNLPIIVYDLKNNETNEFLSIKHFIRHYNLHYTVGMVVSKIEKSKVNPIGNRFIVVFKYKERIKHTYQARLLNRTYYVYDCVTSSLKEFPSFMSIMYAIGICLYNKKSDFIHKLGYIIMKNNKSVPVNLIVNTEVVNRERDKYTNSALYYDKSFFIYNLNTKNIYITYSYTEAQNILNNEYTPDEIRQAVHAANFNCEKTTILDTYAFCKHIKKEWLKFSK